MLDIDGALALGDGRLLTWSDDNAMRLWDGATGACLVVFKGHTSDILGALSLTNGRLVSWYQDDTLLLWDSQSGACLADLLANEKHYYYKHVVGALALPDSRLVTWSDESLRLWDGKSGVYVAALIGHTDDITGALALADGRLLSWSLDRTLRLWDGISGASLAVFTGHTDRIAGASAMSEDRLFSWAAESLRIWDIHTGACLEVVHEDKVWEQYPNLVYEIQKIENREIGDSNFRTDVSACAVNLRHKTIPSILTCWNSESGANPRCLSTDGTIGCTQTNGQVRFLKLYHGNRRISLDELKEIILPNGSVTS
jgi:WD40 repeat protein